MDSKPKRLARRGFLLGAGAAGVAGVSAVALQSAGAPEPQAAQPSKHERGGGGYHASAHVQQYYRTTKI